MATKKTPAHTSRRHFANVPPGKNSSGNSPTTVPTSPPTKIEPKTSSAKAMMTLPPWSVAKWLIGIHANHASMATTNVDIVEMTVK